MKKLKIRSFVRIAASAVILIILGLLVCTLIFSSCEVQASGSDRDVYATKSIASNLQTNQPTPTDISYSLERYNLIRRAYWVNGQREKAASVPCPLDKPLGYIVLFNGNAIVQSFVVDGKVSSLNSYLTPDSEHYEFSGGQYTYTNDWLADVDGSYGENDSGIFFFTPDGNYIEWTGKYLYSDIPMIVDNPVVTLKEAD